MVKPATFAWLVAIVSTSFAQQFGRPDFATTSSTATTTTTSSTSTSTSSTTSSVQSTTSTTLDTTSKASAATEAAATSAKSSALSTHSTASTDTAVSDGQGSSLTTSTSTGISAGSASTQNPTVEPVSSDSRSHGSGLSSTEKLGIGVGVGIGGAVIAGALALFFVLRRRRNPFRDEAARDVPVMSAAAPALVAASDMGRAPTPQSAPRSLSQYSLAPEGEPDPVPVIIAPTPQRSSEKVLSREFQRPPTPEEEPFMAAAMPPQAEVLAPRAGHSSWEPQPPRSPFADGDVSPVSRSGSPVSINTGRPPSPLHDHES